MASKKPLDKIVVPAGMIEDILAKRTEMMINKGVFKKDAGKIAARDFVNSQSQVGDRALGSKKIGVIRPPKLRF
jgi:hypothetical protein